MPVVTLEQSTEELIDLLCGVVLQGHTNETIRKRAEALLVSDHQRRLVRDGKHYITGETRDEYAERASKAYEQRHPITGLTVGEAFPDAPKKEDKK